MSILLDASGTPVEPPEQIELEPEYMKVRVDEYRSLVQAAQDTSILQAAIATLARLRHNKLKISAYELAKTEELDKRVRYYNEGKDFIFLCVDAPKKEEDGKD